VFLLVCCLLWLRCNAAACPQQATSLLAFTNPAELKGACVPVYNKSSLDALIFTLSCKPYGDMAAGLKTTDGKIQLKSTQAKESKN